MIRLTPYHLTRWLCEPVRLQQLAWQVAQFDTCYSAKQVAKARRASLNEAVAFAQPMKPGDGNARPYVCACSGATLASEFNLAEPKQIRAVKGKVGVIPVYGMIDQRMTSALMKAGGTSCESIGAALDAMLAEPSIGAIVMHLDTPGGSAAGLEELSDKVFAARDRKPIYAMADSLAASAGYWLASSAPILVCTPGGYVGSVGVYMMHVDESKALEEAGITVTTVSAGKYKTERAPTGPLTADARENLQKETDAIYTRFCASLARNRGCSATNVKSNYGEGRVLNADDAEDAGMVDRIMPFEELMSRLTGGGGMSSSQITRRAAAQSGVQSIEVLREQVHLERMRSEI